MWKKLRKLAQDFEKQVQIETEDKLNPELAAAKRRVQRGFDIITVKLSHCSDQSFFNKAFKEKDLEKIIDIAFEAFSNKSLWDERDNADVWFEYTRALYSLYLSVEGFETAKRYGNYNKMSFESENWARKIKALDSIFGIK